MRRSLHHVGRLIVDDGSLIAVHGGVANPALLLLAVALSSLAFIGLGIPIALRFRAILMAPEQSNRQFRVMCSGTKKAAPGLCQIDVQTLLPFDRPGRIVESLRTTGRLVLLDEDGSFFIFANDINHGLDVYRFDAGAAVASDPGRWLTPTRALEMAKTRRLTVDKLARPFCLIEPTSLDLSFSGKYL